jgi:hypothetical protein
MDFDKILQTIGDNTTLLLKDGTYHGRFRLIRKSGIIIKGNSSSFDVKIKSSKGIALLLKDCKNCTLENISIESKDLKTPTLALRHIEKINLKHISIFNKLQSMKIEAKSSGISIINSKFIGTISVDDSKNLVHIGANNYPYIYCANGRPA